MAYQLERACAAATLLGMGVLNYRYQTLNNSPGP